MASSASQPFLGLSHNAHPYAPWGGALRDDPKNGQKRFPFNKYSGLKFFGNSTSPFRLTDPSQATGRLVTDIVSRIQKSGIGDNNL